MLKCTSHIPSLNSKPLEQSAIHPAACINSNEEVAFTIGIASGSGVVCMLLLLASDHCFFLQGGVVAIIERFVLFRQRG